MKELIGLFIKLFEWFFPYNIDKKKKIKLQTHSIPI